MNFGFTEEQELLADQARRFVNERCSMKEVRGWIATDPGFSRECLGQMAELGWAGLLIPEAHGGSGLGWVEATIVLEATGAALLPGPLASTLVSGALIAEYGGEACKERQLTGLATAARLGTLALFEDDASLEASGVSLRATPQGEGYRLQGHKSHVHDAAAADVFVVAARTDAGLVLGLVEHGAEGLAVQEHAGIDRTKRLGSLNFEGVQLSDDAILARGNAAEAAYERALDLAALCASAEMVGAAAAVHQLTVGYAKERLQFGKPIGQYQGVKHPLAEMHVDIETARSLLYYAAWLAGGEPAALSRSVSMAKAYISDAFARIGIDAIQLHGAIGYTAEYDAQLYLKRSKFARPAFGDSDFHYERVARLRGL
ncbi:MAG: acyl-CoA/acyl-ACP dehydrogenase [Myxococcales bacterium]|nr:acyl-CoA/acyl-ACP dehydrogenase [Myxococcales bacterium]